MLQIRGKIKSVKASADSGGLVKREVAVTFSDDAVIDELAELMKRGDLLVIRMEPVQLRIGDPVTR